MKELGTSNNPYTLSQYKEMIQKKEQVNRFWKPLAKKLDQIMINQVKIQARILEELQGGEHNSGNYRNELTGKRKVVS